jgi:hypothetical protein
MSDVILFKTLGQNQRIKIRIRAKAKVEGHKFQISCIRKCSEYPSFQILGEKDFLDV